MTSVIVFGPTGQVGSVVARTAVEHGAKVWLAMRNTNKSIPGLTKDLEKAGGFYRIQADLQKPETVSQAVKTSGAQRAFIYLVHGASDHLKSTIAAMKAAGIEFVVFLSSFTIPTNQGLREIASSDLIPHVHAQVEANLDDTFGSDNYVAVRPGCFITNLLLEKNGIAANEVKLYGGTFEQDNIAPSDVGRAIGNILVSGPRNGQKNVYLYGPEILSIHDSIAKIGKVLGKDLAIMTLGPKEGYDNYIVHGMSPAFAKYMVETLSTKGPDKGHGERFPNYEEGVSNMRLYTGKPATSLEDWVKENKTIFGG
ncbi:NAD(P)-binding protein [Delitschia confertaspora ATCC 74209]|uniref:NAD(P)-binding protein n=1 Tax=Delitschia confertaspora ATCC 74209 TaxID=1513339 RepID=A0A9P4JV89_9PLEO|nr:NAD(P)-binding protein [Delitschia confertaspora ATCC 74209]